jgi:nitrite reductase/ring-hydroxylating ferredoxin subunit
MERRDFLRQSSAACLGSLCGGLGALLSGCASSTVIELSPQGNSLRIPIASLDSGTPTIVRPQGEPFEIAVIGSTGKGFTAIQLRCTHADNPLRSTRAGFECALHGSRFGPTGEVLRGPANRQLLRLSTELEGSVLIVRLP